MVNDERQKCFEEILPEILIAKEMSDLRYGTEFKTPNFVEVKSVSLVIGNKHSLALVAARVATLFCLLGAYPVALLATWDAFDERKGSENDRPVVFEEEQMFIVFEFGDGGTDLESIEVSQLTKFHVQQAARPGQNK